MRVYLIIFFLAGKLSLLAQELSSDHLLHIDEEVSVEEKINSSEPEYILFEFEANFLLIDPSKSTRLGLSANLGYRTRNIEKPNYAIMSFTSLNSVGFTIGLAPRYYFKKSLESNKEFFLGLRFALAGFGVEAGYHMPNDYVVHLSLDRFHYGTTLSVGVRVAGKKGALALVGSAVVSAIMYDAIQNSR